MLLYDNAYPSVYEEIKTWYPVWYRDVLEMDAIWRVWGGQLDEIQAGIIQAIDNNFINHCDIQTLGKFEEFLGIQYDGARTVDERRRAIRAYFIGGNHIGKKEIQELISIFTDGAASELEFAPSKETGKNRLTIYVDRKPGPQIRYGDIFAALGRKIPAHLVFELMLKYTIPIGAAARRAHYLFNYEMTGVKPETATLGTINGISAIASAVLSNTHFDFMQAGDEILTGTKPKTAVLGAFNNTVFGVEVQKDTLPFDFAQASENEQAGKKPDDTTLGDFNASTLVTNSVVTADYGVDYKLCGTRAAGI